MNNNTQNPLTNSVSDSCTELQLISLCLAIGSIADSNGMFTAGLTNYISYLGKSLSELTLSELAALAAEYREAFNYGTEPLTEMPCVRTTKHQSLKTQHEIIHHSLTIFSLDASQANQDLVKADTVKLLRMIDDLPDTPESKSRFNVLNKAKQVIAKCVPFNQARQYKNCIIKFSCMEDA